jgi:hypothetical protein
MTYSRQDVTVALRMALSAAVALVILDAHAASANAHARRSHRSAR